MAEEPQIDKSVETIIDRFYDLIVASKSIAVSNAALALSLKPPQVEKLARLLEDAKLVSIDYTLSEMVISIPKSAASKQVSAAHRDDHTANCDDKAAQFLSEAQKIRGAIDFSIKQAKSGSDHIRQITSDPANNAAKLSSAAQAQVTDAAACVNEIRKKSKELMAAADELGSIVESSSCFSQKPGQPKPASPLPSKPVQMQPSKQPAPKAPSNLFRGEAAK